MKYFYTFLILVFLVSSCNRTNEKRVIVLLNTEHNQLLEEQGYEQWEPTKSDLIIIREVLEYAFLDNEFNFLDNC